MSIDRRESRRKILRGPGLITFSGKASERVYLFDISIGGVCVIAKNNYPLKAIVKIEFQVPQINSTSLTAIATPAMIAYSAFSQQENGFKIGLQFTALSDNSKSVILHYLAAEAIAKKIAEKVVEKKAEKNHQANDSKGDDKKS